MMIPPGSPVINQTITGLTQMELELRRSNDELNKRIGQVMASGGAGEPTLPLNPLGQQIQ